MGKQAARKAYQGCTYRLPRLKTTYIAKGGTGMFLFLLFGCFIKQEQPKTEVDTAQCEVSITDIAVGLNDEQKETSETIENELKQMEIPNNR